MATKRILTVTELNNYIKGVFDDELILHNISVIGEVEDFKPYDNATYFTIKDGDNRLSCVMFSRHHEVIDSGTKLELFGGIRFYSKTAKVSFVVKELKVAGKGSAHLEFLKLKEKLEKEGVFTNKKQVPKLINRIALITAETGAVLQDFKKVFASSGISADIKVLAVKVQGEHAKAEIENACRIINTYDICDVCVVMRGGGSSGDLEVFNQESVARAIKSLKVFSVSAVGHETDTTLADLSADYRAATPSIAAQFIVDSVLIMRAKIVGLLQSLAGSVDRLYNTRYARSTLLSLKMEKHASQKIAIANYNINALVNKMQSLVQENLDVSISSVKQNAQSLVRSIDSNVNNKETLARTNIIKLDALSPLKQLDKGFAHVSKDSVAITSVKNINSGDTLTLAFKDCRLDAKVEKKLIINQKSKKQKGN